MPTSVDPLDGSLYSIARAPTGPTVRFKWQLRSEQATLPNITISFLFARKHNHMYVRVRVCHLSVLSPRCIKQCSAFLKTLDGA